jgi:hypothetical protein
LKGGGREALYGGVMFIPCVRRSGLAIMLVALLETGSIPFFLSDVWLGEASFRVRFSRLFYLSVFKGESVFDMWQLGWGRRVRRGGGDGGCLRRRRSWLGELCYCFIM